MTTSVRWLVPVLIASILPQAAHAHHGVAAVGLSTVDGPGAALDTASALALPRNTVHLMLKNEYASFAKYGFAGPQNKEYSSFYSAAAGFGILPWLSVFFFQPYNIKHQDSLGTTSGFGDPSAVFCIGWKYDEGFRLNPGKESVDELEDWHFSAYLSSTLPTGGTDLVDRNGGYFAPDMQSGFGQPSWGVGVAATKLLTPHLTYLAELNFQHFLENEYVFTTYQFGAETRLNNAVAWKVFGKSDWRGDMVAEANLLNLMRDRRMGASGRMEELDASGGFIAYATAGARLYWKHASAALGLKKAFVSFLNEGEDQQGSEGLENFRLMFTLSATVGL